MIKIICDKCDDEIKPDQGYTLTIKDFSADLCMTCAANVQETIENG